MMPNTIPPALVRWSFIAIALVAGLAAAGCGKHGVPLDRTVTIGPSPPDPSVMEKAIESALVRRHWTVKEKAPGRYTATQDEKKFSATVAILYDAQSARIEYVDSTNLLYEKTEKGELIHGNYNKWVKNLANDIRVATGAPPPGAAAAAPPPAAPPAPPAAK